MVKVTLATVLVASATLVSPLAARAATTLPQEWSYTVQETAQSAPPSTVSSQPFGGATLGDLSGDGQMDVVAGFPDGSVWAFNAASGAVLPGWPQYTGGALHTNPTVADLFNNGQEEVIATSEAGSVYVWNASGQLEPGWPQHPASNAAFFGGVAVGDLLGNGQMDLVAASWDQYLYAWTPNGQILPGFPIHMWDSAWDTPVLVDLEHQGQLDIVSGVDSTGPPYDPYPPGGEVWAFRPTGCVAGAYADQQPCALPGWPKLMNQTPWASMAAADLQGTGTDDIIEGSGNDFAEPNGDYVNAWTANGGSVGGWPQATGARNFSSPAVGSLFGNGSLDVVEASETGLLYAWNSSGQLLPGWPVNPSGCTSGPACQFMAYPTIAPIGSGNENGVWITSGINLYGYSGAGQVVDTATGLGCGADAAPAVGALGNGGLSVVTVDQTDCTSTPSSWTVTAFSIPGTTTMLPDAWPQFHGNAQLTGTITPTPAPFMAPGVGAPVVALSTLTAQKEVFWRGPGDDHLDEASYSIPAEEWSGPVDLSATLAIPSAGDLASAPSVTFSPGGGQELVFWQGANGDLWEAWYTLATGVWRSQDLTAALGLAGAGTVASTPMVTFTPGGGQQLVFWQGTDGDLWEAWYTVATNTWLSQDLSTGLLAGRGSDGTVASTPTVILTPGGGQQLAFWQGVNGHVWEAWYTVATHTWDVQDLTSGRFSGAAGVSSKPTVLLTPNAGQQLVFYQATDGDLWEAWYSVASNAWQAQDLSSAQLAGAGSLASAPQVVVTPGGGQQLVFWQTAGGQLDEAWYAVGSHLWAEQDLSAAEGLQSGADLTSAPAVTALFGSEQDVFWQGPGETLWELYFSGTMWTAHEWTT